MCWRFHSSAIWCHVSWLQVTWANFSTMLIPVYQSARHHIPGGWNLYSQSYMKYFTLLDYFNYFNFSWWISLHKLPVYVRLLLSLFILLLLLLLSILLLHWSHTVQSSTIYWTQFYHLVSCVITHSPISCIWHWCQISQFHTSCSFFHYVCKSFLFLYFHYELCICGICLQTYLTKISVFNLTMV